MTVADLRSLRITSLEQVEDLIGKYLAVDLPKAHHLVFLEQMTARRDSWFIEAGELGLIYFTDIVPGRNANLQVLFWDKKFDRVRRELVLSVVGTAFARFDLIRITVVVPANHDPLYKRYLKMGFVQEGLIRKSGAQGVDEYILGFLREDFPWHVTPVPQSFLG